MGTDAPPRPNPLPLTVWHNRGEPAHGLLARAVDLNVPGALRTYRRLFGSKDGHLVTNIPPREVALFCSADPDRVATSSPRFEGQFVSLLGELLRGRDYSVRHRRWCPDCLLEAGWHRAWWDVGFVTSCPRHGCSLVDLCPCGRNITWANQPGLLFCTCGRELATAPSARLSDGECAFDRYVVGRMTGEGVLRDAWLDPLPLHEAADLVRQLGGFVLDPFQERSFSGNQDSVREVMAAGFQAVSDFPASVERAMERVRTEEDRLKPPHFLHSNEFRSWLVESEPASLAGALSGFFLHHARRDRRPGAEGEIPYGWFRLEHGADLCCVSQAEFRRILRALGAWPRRGTAGGWLCIDPFFLGWLARNVRNGKDIKELADDLDVTEADARSLVQTGLVQPFVPRGWGIREFFGPAEPEALLRKMATKIAPRETEFKRLYPLPLAADDLGLSIADAVIDVLDDRLPVHALSKQGIGISKFLVALM